MRFRDIVGAAFAAARWESFDCGDLKPTLVDGRLRVPPALLRELSREAFRRAAYYLRPTHLAALAAVLEDPLSSENDRFVVSALLRNALVASRGELPLCQDTGTATVMAWKDESVSTGADDEEALSEGARDAYSRYWLRSSQAAPLSLFGEYDTGDNLPAQVHAEATADGGGGPSYRFLFVAKGGGSANKTALFQMSKALLEPAAFERFLREKVAALGVAACPPYRLAVVVGGTSPEENLRVLKLATTEILDAAPPFGAAEEPLELARERGFLRRDGAAEALLMDIARGCGLGAQFGGTALALDARVLRMPRHAGSCPVSIGVSCSAHRNVLAVVDADGARIEALERRPEAFLESLGGKAADIVLSSRPADGVRIDLSRPFEEVLAALSRLPAGSRVLLSGPLLVARDAAHLRWHALVEGGGPLPDYLRGRVVYYAGPSATPPGKTIGSFGPTTAQRMDGYADELMSRGAALVTLAKGNRAPAWAAACRRYGGFYLGTVGGAAALIAEENIESSEVVDYADLGMEAVRLVKVRDLSAFLVVDDKGNDLYSPSPKA